MGVTNRYNASKSRRADETFTIEPGAGGIPGSPISGTAPHNMIVNWPVITAAQVGAGVRPEWWSEDAVGLLTAETSGGAFFYDVLRFNGGPATGGLFVYQRMFVAEHDLLKLASNLGLTVSASAYLTGLTGGTVTILVRDDFGTLASGTSSGTANQLVKAENGLPVGASATFVDIALSMSINNTNFDFLFPQANLGNTVFDWNINPSVPGRFSTIFEVLNITATNSGVWNILSLASAAGSAMTHTVHLAWSIDKDNNKGAALATAPGYYLALNPTPSNPFRTGQTAGSKQVARWSVFPMQCDENQDVLWGRLAPVFPDNGNLIVNFRGSERWAY